MKMWMVIVSALTMCSGCVTLKAEHQLPVVQNLENWKAPFLSWSKGLDFPVTVVVMRESGGRFVAYGVDPDSRRIHFVAVSHAQEQLRELAGDPTFGTVVVIEGKALGHTNVTASGRQGLPSSRVQVAVDLVRDAYFAPPLASNP